MFKPGDQIIYVPSHVVVNNIKDFVWDHPHVERGFVMSVKYETVTNVPLIFCRYWLKTMIGQLRTVANSELTPVERLHLFKTHSQEFIEKTMECILLNLL